MPEILEELKCYHCGDSSRTAEINFDNRTFCCEGCRLVYEILQENNLCSYYHLNENPGLSPVKNYDTDKYAFLDDTQIISRLLSYSDSKQSHVTFYIPKIHCSSCIWLLENLNKLDNNIHSVRVNFLKKQASIVFSSQLKLKELAVLLASIGYAPELNLNDVFKEKKSNPVSRERLYRLGVAGFCFGNIMLLSFPEYLSHNNYLEIQYKNLFGYLNLILALPVFFYSSKEFFNSAWNGLKQKLINIDFPIVLGLIVMFTRSSYEIISGTGAGYMDSLAALVFLMLLGRIFHEKTFNHISFDRDYKSYFPIGITTIKNGIEKNIPVSNLKEGEKILVRSMELIPADATLLSGKALIDYSFVTGESQPVEIKVGEKIYAGGKQTGEAIELVVIRKVSQSHFNSLWNKQQDELKSNYFSLTINKISKSFTIAIVVIAVLSGLYWYSADTLKAWNAFTAVLIIACPCALALSTPFTLGNALRILGKRKIYLKNGQTIEELSKVNSIVFDKTGTITHADDMAVYYDEKALNDEDKIAVKSLVRQSSHPLSKIIYKLWKTDKLYKISDYREITGKGIEARIGSDHYKLGSAAFTGHSNKISSINTVVYLKKNSANICVFNFRSKYRQGFEEIIKNLSEKYEISLVSGDNNSDQKYLSSLFDPEQLYFGQLPDEKMRFIESKQQSGKKVLMIGDGLNDASALLQSNVGMAVSDNLNNFSPASDIIIDGSKFNSIPSLLKYARASYFIILASFAISFLYNLVGLSVAVQGILSPVFAAVFMPLSSVTILLFTTGATNLAARWLKI